LIIANDNLQKADSSDLKGHYDAVQIAKKEAEISLQLLFVKEKKVQIFLRHCTKEEERIQ
jgi:hypothetical protein